jgi:hypothetical protein
MRQLLLALLASAALGVLAPSAFAAGGRYTFDGGTPKEQATVRAALNASGFDWNVVPQATTVHIRPGIGTSYSTPGNVYLDPSLLDAGEFSWGVVQHEFGHQVDFALFDAQKRATLLGALGGADWCYGAPNLAHDQYGCERFASELAWAYWPSPDNSMAPQYCNGESAHMPVAQFRTLLAQLLGEPGLASPPPTVKAYQPAVRRKKK